MDLNKIVRVELNHDNLKSKMVNDILHKELNDANDSINDLLVELSHNINKKYTLSLYDLKCNIHDHLNLIIKRIPYCEENAENAEKLKTIFDHIRLIPISLSLLDMNSNVKLSLNDSIININKDSISIDDETKFEDFKSKINEIEELTNNEILLILNLLISLVYPNIIIDEELKFQDECVVNKIKFQDEFVEIENKNKENG